jgi:hypothetical protein
MGRFSHVDSVDGVCYTICGCQSVLCVSSGSRQAGHIWLKFVFLFFTIIVFDM